MATTAKVAGGCCEGCEYILRSILFLLITAIVQQIGLQLLDVPDSERGGLRIILCYILPTVLLALAYWQWRKIGVFNRRAWMVQNPAQFSPYLIDCYVRFKGSVAAEQTCRMSVSGIECVYYAVLIVAEWPVKRKKPAKGWEIVRKPLLREQSADELELANKDCRVYINVEEFTKSCLCLHSKEKTQENCPSWAQIQDNVKYKTFRLLEQFIFPMDSITVQGRLSLNKDGRLFIKPTHRLEFPSFLAVQKEASQFIYEIAEKARNAAWSKRINAAFLLLNAGLFIYFWH